MFLYDRCQYIKSKTLLYAAFHLVLIVNITCVDPQTDAKPNTEMKFLVDMNRMHLFDKQTQKAY